jgi:hypothetical protein
MANKTGGSLKGIFDPAKKAAAAAVMEPAAEAAIQTGTMARNRKAGGRNVRVSGYIPPELEAALRDEVIRRTVAERKTVSLNDVLCDALAFWHQHGQAGQ